VVKPGESTLSRSFGASVEVGRQAEALTVVVGRGRSPNTAVRSEGGKTVAVLSDKVVLAVVPLHSQLSLRQRRDVSFVGAVSVDIKRMQSLLTYRVHREGDLRE